MYNRNLYKLLRLDLAMVLNKIKSGLSNLFKGSNQEEAEYIEIDLGREAKKAKIVVRPFVLKSFEDVNNILNALREGYSIAVIDIKPLKNKDIIELKRAISKIKKTADALEGDIAGFGEGTVIVTPGFAHIAKIPAAEKSAEGTNLD
jgi:SepF-like predicted cell division protein (DUF552 family)